MSVRTGTWAGVAVGAAAVVAALAVGDAGPAAGSSGVGNPPADTVELVPTTAVTPETDGIVESDQATGTEGEGSAESGNAGRASATFAGGCFWCMEPPYDELEGVISTTSGYAGGHVEDPTYEEVSSGGTGHREVMQVVYDPSAVSYTKLLDVFWRNVDPTDGEGQFCDRGFQYTTAIYVHNEEQRELAEASRRRLRESGVLDGEVVTPVEPLEAFYPAEEYHQNYYQKNKLRYKFYRWNCGRDERLEEIWGETAGG